MKIKMAGFLFAAIAVVVLFAAPDLMAIGNGPQAAEISSNDYGIPYFGWLASIGGGLLGLLVIRRKYFRK
ncbi:MAG: hypothetical protein IH846_06045 [Acidobacteria bacterium]|nr:hypothetical protein [Acidobacteriota bacterium]